MNIHISTGFYINKMKGKVCAMGEKIKKIISAALSVCLCSCLLPKSVSEFNVSAAQSYPVQQFRFGMYNTDNNVSADNAVLCPSEQTGTANEKWSLNYISEGVYEIVNSQNGNILTANGSGVTLAADTDGSNQRWKIEGVEKDFEGYYLYYKITSNADSSKSLTYNEKSGFSLSAYSGQDYWI